MELEKWIKKNRLRATFEEPVFKYHHEGEEVKIRLLEIFLNGEVDANDLMIPPTRFLVLEPDEVMLDKKGDLIVLDFEHKAFIQEGCYYLIYSFGGKWYYGSMYKGITENNPNYYVKEPNVNAPLIPLTKDINTDFGSISVEFDEFKYLGKAAYSLRAQYHMARMNLVRLKRQQESGIDNTENIVLLQKQIAEMENV